MIEIFAEDQYAVVSGAIELLQLEQVLRQTGLQYRAPLLPLSIEDWLLSGGVGLLDSLPVRKDVLGLRYQSIHGVVEVGGKVVKNVAGYDAVRLVVGSDATLEHRLRIESATLRLRPRVEVLHREMQRSEDANFHVLRELGATYAVAYKRDATWYIRAEFWAKAPTWGHEVVYALTRDDELHDAFGIFPRHHKDLSNLEARVLAAL